LTDREHDLFGKYLDLLLKWQKVHRLIGSGDSRWIVSNVFLDSLLFLKLIPREALEILDVGSGAGIPGIPLKIVRSELHMTLVESRQRRASFLSTVVRELELRDIVVVSDRLETVVRDRAESFDAVVARCAGDLGYVFGIGAHLVRVGGLIIASGPPREHRLPAGRWVTVPGIQPGKSRRFAVFEG
jgi:16S rRNA (guanine527-N7)-methyltransferase